ncbi:MAG: hypothetical protein LBK99_23860 [Opitutaceae bacterium]|jgi:hypothetical protein|nr:hypothetical protein [Opitutaceae bacterium]
MINEYIKVTDRAEFARIIKKARKLLIGFFSVDRDDEGHNARGLIHLPAKAAIEAVMRGSYDGFAWETDDKGTAWLRDYLAPREVRMARKIDLLVRSKGRDVALLSQIMVGVHNADFRKEVIERIARRDAEIAALSATLDHYADTLSRSEAPGCVPQQTPPQLPAREGGVTGEAGLVIEHGTAGPRDKAVIERNHDIIPDGPTEIYSAA